MKTIKVAKRKVKMKNPKQTPKIKKYTMNVAISWTVSGVEGTDLDNALYNLNEMFKKTHNVSIENSNITEIKEEK
jgi:hypothetical protein